MRHLIKLCGKKDIEQLMFNRSFGVLTREAFRLLITRIPTDSTALVVFDIDNMKAANTKLGKEEVNKRLALAFSFRSGDILLGQTFSGDEFAALIHGDDAEGFALRLQQALHQQGMSATIVIETYVGDSTFSTTEDMVSTMKANNQKDTILDMRKTK